MIRCWILPLLICGAEVAASAHPEPDELQTPAAGAVDEADAARPRQLPGQQLPLTPTRRISFVTDEATWASLDLSPDDRTMVFDLLGDLYTVPARGGDARRIVGGMGVDVQPTYSPDGRWIAFVSDRSGAENLWLVRPDGSGLRQVSFGNDDTNLISPAWSADGRTLFVSRHRPDLNAYELWRYGLSGGKSLLVPVRDKPDTPRSEWRSSLGAAPFPDGRYLYMARHVGPLEFDKVGEWTIVRRDLTSGEETTIVSEPEGPRKPLNPGAAFRPAVSTDGTRLAYAVRLDGQTQVRLRDLRTGDDRALAYPIQHDQLQAAMWQDIVPRFDWTRDGKAILLSRNNRFERIAVDRGAARAIPFRTRVDLALGPLLRTRIREETGPVRARIVQHPAMSPSGDRLAFSALARIYVMPLTPAARARQLPAAAPAFEPSWSPDGRRIAYVTWTAREGGQVWTAAADGSEPPRRITKSAGFYTNPVFTPDGTRVLALRSSQAARLRTYMEFGSERRAELISLPLNGGRPKVLASGSLGGRLHFTDAPGKTYLQMDGALAEVDLASGAHRTVARITGPGWYFQEGPVAVNAVQLSPDGKWILALVAQQLHLVARPPADKPEVNLEAPGLPHRRLTTEGADFVEWSRDGKAIGWAAGSNFYRRRLADVALNPAEYPNWSGQAANTPTQVYPATVEVARDRPAGNLLLSGARAITMAGTQVIESADILVTGDRIAGIGPKGSLRTPPGTVVRDVSGKTIVPGFIDNHDHLGEVRRELLDLESWGARARLAYGVTTVFDPSTLTIDMLAYQDLIDAGLMIGPRLRSTGVALFSMQRFSSLDEAREVLRRYRDRYRLGNVKQYRTGGRKVRQWVAMAAHELGLASTAEGALALKLDLSQVLDGFGQEHALVAVPIGRDWTQLMARAGSSYTTTLQITNGGYPAQDHYIIRENPHDDAKYRRFTPHVAADQATRRREWRAPGEHIYPAVAAGAAQVQRAGGLVGMGAHGDMPGVGYHWELEAHAEGGMRPLEILRAATIGAARTISRADDLGSLEPGKLADLVILDKDPRDDIRNARAIAAVMKGGRLYDGDSLDQLWPDRVRLPEPWFASDRWNYQGDVK